MKKFIFSALAAIGLWLTPSCSDDNEALSGSGNEALVSFNVNLADGINTKADGPEISDGKKATNLVVDVFEKDNLNGDYTRINDLRVAKDNKFSSGLTTTVEFKLVKGKTYRLIFWAQAQSVESQISNPPYDITDLSTITVNYNAGITDDENRDAFLGVTDPITVNADILNQPIDLYRPFAQLNYLIDAAEYTAAKKAGMDIKKAKVTVAKVAKKLHPLTKTVSDFEENKMFEVTAIPTNFNADPLTGEDHLNLPKAGRSSTSNDMQDYYYLASKYFLVAVGNGVENSALDQAILATTSFKLVNNSDQEIADYEFKVPAVPVQWNYRTNIYGNLITSQRNFAVTIKPGFSENINRPQSSVTVDNDSEIATAIASGATTIVASESFDLSTPTTITVPRNYTEENNGVELTFDFSNVATNSTAIKITYNNGQNQKGPENVNVVATGTVEIDLEDSHVTLNGNEVNNRGTYTEVTASTSGTTLVVPDGVTVERLIVKKGNVRIEKGGKVTNIVRHEEADANKPTYVTIVTGGELTNTPEDEKIIITYEDATAGNVVLNGVYSFNTVKEAVAYASSKNISDVKLVLAAGEYQEAVSIPSNTTVSIEPASGLSANDVKFNGQLASLGNGVLNVKNITISHNPTIDLTGISQTGASAIALWGAAVVNCENVTFENFANNATAITSWWSTGAGTQINVKNSTFNCGGQRPIRSDANVTVEGCTFTDPYRYAVQMTSKSSTMTAKNAVVNFKNNTINAGTASTKNVVYGIQLEGETYGCSNLIINGSGNTINVGETSKTCAMYYCECGKVDHATIQWNVETAIVHAENYITTKDELIAFAKAVNEEGKTFAHQYVFLGADIDLENEAWEPIGQTGKTQFQGTFDGQNFTIKNLKVESNYESSIYACGLFGWLNTATVKNVKVDGANISAHVYSGVIAGYMESIPKCTIENCHVVNANLSCTSIDPNGADGDKCGGIVGFAANLWEGKIGDLVKDCTVKNTKISAGRDAGQVVGCAKEVNVENCSAENVTVTANGTSTGANIREEVIGRVL